MQKEVKQAFKQIMSEKDSFIKANEVFNKNELLELLWIYHQRCLKKTNIKNPQHPTH